MSSLRGPLGACWGSGRLPPPGKNESPALHGAFRCFRLVRRTLTVHERGEIGCQRGNRTIRRRQTNRAMTKGTAERYMVPGVPPATSFMTKRLMPKGGVMEAMLSA